MIFVSEDGWFYVDEDDCAHGPFVDREAVNAAYRKYYARLHSHVK